MLRYVRNYLSVLVAERMPELCVVRHEHICRAVVAKLFGSAADILTDHEHVECSARFCNDLVSEGDG